MKKLLLFLFFGILPLSAFAADSYLVTNGGSEVITEHSVCNLVTNSAGQTIMVPTKTAGEWSSFRTNTPTNVTSVACDTTPAGYNFTNKTNQNLNTLIYSNIVTITGINTTTSVSVSGQGTPRIQINGGGWVASGTITNGQTLRVRLTSANANSSTRTATVNVGGVTDAWNVTTKAPSNCTSKTFTATAQGCDSINTGAMTHNQNKVLSRNDGVCNNNNDYWCEWYGNVKCVNGVISKVSNGGTIALQCLRELIDTGG